MLPSEGDTALSKGQHGQPTPPERRPACGLVPVWDPASLLQKQGLWPPAACKTLQSKVPGKPATDVGRRHWWPRCVFGVLESHAMKEPASAAGCTVPHAGCMGPRPEP